MEAGSFIENGCAYFFHLHKDWPQISWSTYFTTVRHFTYLTQASQLELLPGLSQHPIQEFRKSPLRLWRRCLEASILAFNVAALDKVL